MLRTQFIYLLSARVFASAAQAVVLLILARVVDVNSFGVLNSALVAGLLAVGAADFGTSTLLAKAQAKRDFETADACIKFSVSTTFICIVALLVAVAWYTKFDSLTGPLITLAVGVSLEKNAECLLSVPMANGNKFIAPLSVLLRRSVTLLAFVCMLLLGVSAEWAYGLSYLVGSVAGQIHLRHTVAEAPPLWSPGKLGVGIMRKAFPYFVSNISAQSRLLDLPVVALTSSAIAAGLYAGATKVTSPFMLIPTVLTVLIMPHSVRQRKHIAAALARKMFIFAVLTELLFFAPLALFSDRLVVLLLGHAFTAAAPAFAWTLVGIPFFGLASPLGSVLQSQGKERIVAVNGVVFAVVSLCGTATLCILFGIWGAAAAMTISYGLKCIVLMLIINRTLKRTHHRMSTERADADEMSPQHAGADEARPEVHDERIGGPPSTYSTWRKGGHS